MLIAMTKYFLAVCRRPDTKYLQLRKPRVLREISRFTQSFILSRCAYIPLLIGTIAAWLLTPPSGHKAISISTYHYTSS